MNPLSRIQWIALALIAAAMVASGFLTTALSAEAGRAQLVYTDQATEGDPPEVGVGIALGAFRGLFTNVLWIRAQQLKQEGKFFDSMELARTITKLQPRFPRVWVFHAWNMAYNISVATDTAEERWTWVQAGVNLLRSEGIPKNPRDPLLHKELAWIFNHKIQGYLDDAHLYYKRSLAEEWQIVLGPPPPDAGEVFEERTQTYVRWLTALSEAPDTLEEVIRTQPLVATLVERLRREAGLEPGMEMLRQLEYELALAESMGARAIGLELSAEHRNDAMRDIMGEETLGPAWQALIPHVRKRLLIDRYNMEPGRMIRYTQKFGPLDWRHASSHALYWSLRGDELSRTDKYVLNDFDLTNTNRISLHALQELRRSGEIYFNLLYDNYVALPNLDFIPAYKALFEELLEKNEDNDSLFFNRAKAFSSFGSGYENFMADSIRLLYREGRRRDAQALLDELRNWEGLNINDPLRLQERFGRTLDDFVRAELEDQLKTPYVIVEEVSASVRNGVLGGLVRGNRARFEANIRYAKQVHEYYMSEQNVRTLADPDRNRLEVLPARFEDAAGQLFASMLASGAMGVDDQAIAWRRAPQWLQWSAYEPLLELTGSTDLNEQQQAMLDRVFPPPMGQATYADWRRQLEEASDAARKRDVGTERR